MCALVDCVCGARPERRDVSNGRCLYVCTNPECGQFSEPSLNEAYTRRVWNQANGTDAECLSCDRRPRLRYSSKRRLWAMQCTGCGRSTSGAHSADGAITAWTRGNRQGSEHTRNLWLARAGQRV